MDIYFKFGVLILLSTFLSAANGQQTKKAEQLNQIQWNYPTKEVNQLILSAKKISLTWKELDEKKEPYIQIGSVEKLELSPVVESNVLKLIEPLKSLEVILVGRWSKVDILSEELSVKAVNIPSAFSIKTRALYLDVKEVNSSAQIACRTGKLHIQSLTGNLSIENQMAEIVIGKGEGNLKVESFSGNHRLNNWVGNIQITAQNGQWKVDSGEGNLVYKSQLADLQLSNRNGQLKANTIAGNLVLQMPEGAKLRASSEDGNVSVRLPSQSGAHINLGSVDGDMNFPRYLELKRYPKLKIATGRLRGRLAGSVFVRTDKGRIDLK